MLTTPETVYWHPRIQNPGKYTDVRLSVDFWEVLFLIIAYITRLWHCRLTKMFAKWTYNALVDFRAQNFFSKRRRQQRRSVIADSARWRYQSMFQRPWLLLLCRPLTRSQRRLRDAPATLSARQYFRWAYCYLFRSWSSTRLLLLPLKQCSI